MVFFVSIHYMEIFTKENNENIDYNSNEKKILCINLNIVEKI